MAVSKSMDASNLKEIIRFHRKKSGLTQLELAHLADVGKTAIYDLEKGKITIRLDTLLKVLKVLNVRIDFQSQLMELLKESIHEKG